MTLKEAVDIYPELRRLEETGRESEALVEATRKMFGHAGPLNIIALKDECYREIARAYMGYPRNDDGKLMFR